MSSVCSSKNIKLSDPEANFYSEMFKASVGEPAELMCGSKYDDVETCARLVPHVTTRVNEMISRPPGEVPDLSYSVVYAFQRMLHKTSSSLFGV